MRMYELKFTIMEDTGKLCISATNDGFTSMELIALLEMKKNDILAQIAPDAHFKRVFVDGDGAEIEVKGENK